MSVKEPRRLQIANVEFQLISHDTEARHRKGMFLLSTYTERLWTSIRLAQIFTECQVTDAKSPIYPAEITDDSLSRIDLTRDFDCEIN
jgi:hypothetical protein